MGIKFLRKFGMGIEFLRMIGMGERKSWNRNVIGNSGNK